MIDDAAFISALAMLATTQRLLVCCDFDGTIATLVDDPAAARPVDGALAALDALALLPATWSTIMSGRALIDLTQLARVPDRVHLVGSHGNEFEVGRILAFGPAQASLLEAVASQCLALTRDMPGVFIEQKPASVAVHVRRADPLVAAEALEVVRAGPGALPSVHLIEGKCVVELAVTSGGKGDAIDVLRARWAATAVFFAGDDKTDESAFRSLAVGDVSIKVGEGTSAANWRIADPNAVVRVLERLLSLRMAHFAARQR